MKHLCIYHGNCADGFTAAWAVRAFCIQNRIDIDFHPGVYQNEPPDMRGRIVIFVDFSYKREVMMQLLTGDNRPEAILLIDHHKTAVEDLKADGGYIIDFGAYSGVKDWKRFRENVALDHIEGGPRIYTVFDMNRSGAGMAWDFFFPESPRPKLVDHVEDRDLWRFALPRTREIQAAVFSYPYDFDVWDMLADSFDMYGNSPLADEGAAIERKHHKDVAELTKVVTRPMRIAGHVVPVANLPYTLTSDAGHLLCSVPDPNGPPGTFIDYPFAGCYWDTPEGRVFSLRSREGGADVGEIAKRYGGGGHKNASGFRIPFDRVHEFECTAFS